MRTTSRPRARAGIVQRVRALDWGQIEKALAEQGHASTGPVLTGEECAGLAALFSDDRRFRSRVDMARLRFGRGEYAYFARPLPRLVRDLRAATYPPLARIANRWMEALGDERRFPAGLAGLHALCARHGQTKPTPLLLRYQAGGYNCLHRDIYGEIVFPLQLTCFLSSPGIDHGGGEFLLLEQRPRAQARGEVIRPERGALLFFPSSVRPQPATRGWSRTAVRHGLARVRWGTRFALGVIYHDAR